MQPDTSPPRGSRAISSLAYWRDILLIGSLGIYGLYAGSAFLIPLTLAVLIFVLIAAISDRVEDLALFGRSLPVWMANVVAIAAVLSAVFAVAFVLADQASSIVRIAPDYEARFDVIVSRVAGFAGVEAVTTLRDALVRLDVSRFAIGLFGGATSFLSTFLLISLYVAFMMAERKSFAQKLHLAVGDMKLGRDLAAILQDISTSLQRYLMVKTFVSGLTGLFSYGVFKLLGLEFAETWGILTFALNFIPSIGSVVAVIFPALIALLQFESVTPFLIVVFGTGTVQFMIGNFLDPALTGRSLNLSTLMVILALTFWTSIWGILGAFLSVPLTVCILLIFWQVPATRPLAILMSMDGRLDIHPGDETKGVTEPEPDI
jgi:AI-2 transport protein TqsA